MCTLKVNLSGLKFTKIRSLSSSRPHSLSLANKLIGPNSNEVPTSVAISSHIVFFLTHLLTLL
jgi:hypothetical protein